MEPGGSPTPEPADQYRDVSLEELEREHILATLEETGWNKSKSSQILGIERSTLDRKLKRMAMASNPTLSKYAIALSRIELEQARLMVLKTAWLLDQSDWRAARREVSMIKVAVAQTYTRIADRAMQLFGAMGGSDDTPIAAAYALSIEDRQFHPRHGI